jgi:hypothetical protein
VFVLCFYLSNKSQIIFLHLELNTSTINRDLNISSACKYKIVVHFLLSDLIVEFL